MYDDYDLDYTFGQDYNLDEDTYYEHYAQLDASNDLDEDYAHNTQDYDALAYKHYAWYNLVHTRTPIPPHLESCTCLPSVQYVLHLI